MRPKVYEVFEQARALADDDEFNFGGTVFQNDKLMPHYRRAYRDYFRSARKHDIPQATARAFLVVPPSTSLVDPVSHGISNFNAPQKVQIRPSSDPIQATFTLGFPVSVSRVGHGLSSGDMIVAYNFPITSEVMALNGAWPVSVVDPDTFTLNGSRLVNGEGTEVEGTYSLSRGDFSLPLTMMRDIPDVQGNGSQYAFTGGGIYLHPTTEARQLLVTYLVSGDAPRLLHEEVPIDDSLDFLAEYTIGLAMASKDDPRGQQHIVNAVGPDFVNGVAGGQLEALLHGQAISTHNIQVQRPAFRPRRTSRFAW